MTTSRNQLDGQSLRRTLFRARAWSLALATLFVFLVPTIRTGDLSEAGTTKERVEDVSFTTRTASLLRSAPHGRREVIVFTSSIQARLGRDQRPDVDALPGHRLPNGLMAPITC